MNYLILFLVNSRNNNTLIMQALNKPQFQYLVQKLLSISRMNKLAMTFLLLAMLCGVCFSTITWTSKSLSNSKTAYYSANCGVVSSKLKSVGKHWAITVSQCISMCNNADVFTFDGSSNLICSCFQRNKTVAPYPFYEVKSPTTYCGCIESARG